MKWVKMLGKVIGGLALLIVALAIASRFADGPLVEMLPGGPLVSGTLVESGPSNWSFVEDVQTIELESDGRSRKTYILTVDGDAYISALLSFPPFKKWHKAALDNPDAVIRIEGKRYPRQLTKIDDPQIEARLTAQMIERFGVDPAENGGIWFFRLDPPS